MTRPARQTIQLTPELREGLLLAASVVGLLTLILGLLMPASGRLARRRAALGELRGRIAAGHAMVESRAAHVEALERARAGFDPWKARVGTDQSVARVLEELTQRAGQRHLELVAVQPKAEEAPRVLSVSGGLTVREMPVHLRLTGRYRQIGEFLGTLRGGRFLAAVRRIALARSEEGGAVLNAEVDLLIYLQESPVG